LQYEDPTYQEAARKTVPIAELEERALVALAKKVGSLLSFLDFDVRLLDLDYMIHINDILSMI